MRDKKVIDLQSRPKKIIHRSMDEINKEAQDKRKKEIENLRNKWLKKNK